MGNVVFFLWSIFNIILVFITIGIGLYKPIDPVYIAVNIVYFIYAYYLILSILIMLEIKLNYEKNFHNNQVFLVFPTTRYGVIKKEFLRLICNLNFVISTLLFISAILLYRTEGILSFLSTLIIAILTHILLITIFIFFKNINLNRDKQIENVQNTYTYLSVFAVLINAFAEESGVLLLAHKIYPFGGLIISFGYKVQSINIITFISIPLLTLSMFAFMKRRFNNWA